MSSATLAPGFRGPLAVGGVGGSGTRLVARVLLGLGFDLGPDRNEAEDNLWFTFLLRNIPPRARRRTARVSSALEVFARAMGRQPLSTARERAVLIGAAADATKACNPDASLPWALRRVARILSAPACSPERAPWGWKEPNTHLFLPELNERLRGLRYIHVIRHGSEVVAGSNWKQFHRWGAVFGIDTRAPDPARGAFKYWIRANVRAVTYARRAMDGRFLLVDHGALCANPGSEIDRIVAFAGQRVDARLRTTLVAMPDASRARRRPPPWRGGAYDEEDRAGLALLGYD